MMQKRQITLTILHKKIQRQFIISSNTKPNALKNLVKKAFHLQSQVNHLKGYDHIKISFEQIIIKARSGQYQVYLDDESSEDKSKSEVCSQKNMSKVSGRKNPPSEKELLDSKFYIDDFQLFMSEVSAKKTSKLFGIVFFNSKKKALFLGKKILRQLIFEFDRIEFFYALHPIKMHTSSALLGEVLFFSLFRGKKMIHQRQFSEQITAADEIPNYIKNLIKIGQLTFEQLPNQQKKPKNLIHVHQQRSFDHKIEKSPQKLSDFGNKPNRTTEMIKIQSVTPDKEIKRKIFTNPKAQSPIKSHITNEISFENDFYQPEWFFEGETLTRLQKGILSALIKSNDSNMLTFLNGLNLKSSLKQKLNVKLIKVILPHIKVFLKEFIDEKFTALTQKQKRFIENNQEERKSFVFNSLLKLYKFGDINDFVQNITKGLANSLEDKEKHSKDVIHYSNIAKNNEKNKPGFTIKLLDCENGYQKVSPRQHPSPFREDSKMYLHHTQLAKLFHEKPLEQISTSIFRDIQFGKQYEEAERAGIRDLILKNDALMIEAFIRNTTRTKKMDKIPAKIVKKYLRQVESRYDRIRQRAVANFNLNLKMQRLEIFNGLVYYLYKLRIINKKQLKISFYLYTWSDLNILSAFEVYLYDRNVDEFVDTIYSIDYNYCLRGLYEIDHSQVQQFTLDVQSQLIILFLYQNYIDSGDERMSLEKFIRAGDNSLLKLYTDLKIGEEDLIRKMIELSKIKKNQLDSINQNQKITELEEKEKKKQRCNFIEQIVSARMKNFTKKQLIKYCINNDQPTITSMFDLLDSNNEQLEFVESLKLYAENIDQIHMKNVIEQIAKLGNIDVKKIYQCRTDIIKGIYEVHLATNDKNDTLDSLERAVRKRSKSNSPK